MSREIKIKVCGMRETENIRNISLFNPDYLGFIFFESSPRKVDGIPDFSNIPDQVKRVGVFVNPQLDFILQKAEEFGLDFIQLHGDETPELCKKLKSEKFGVIKVFGLTHNFDFKKLEPYKNHVDYFLFDTKSSQYGGTGQKFNWEVLTEYDQEIPFFISGGIGPGDASEIKNLKDLNIHAVDINSRFEISPGYKDIKKVQSFIKELNHVKVG